MNVIVLWLTLALIKYHFYWLMDSFLLSGKCHCSLASLKRFKRINIGYESINGSSVALVRVFHEKAFKVCTGFMLKENIVLATTQCLENLFWNCSSIPHIKIAKPQVSFKDLSDIEKLPSFEVERRQHFFHCDASKNVNMQQFILCCFFKCKILSELFESHPKCRIVQLF